MGLSNIVDIGVFSAGAFLGGGIGVAVIEGFFHKPKERALTEKEKALAEKERALADAAKSDTSFELVKLWMVSNEKLLESNKYLEKSNERIQTLNAKLQREMNETRRVLTTLAAVVERIMPLLEHALGDDTELRKLSAALQRAQALND